jgi:hypothetical protein
MLILILHCRNHIGDPRVQAALGVLLGINLTTPENMDVDPPSRRPEPKQSPKEEKMDTTPAKDLTEVKNVKILENDNFNSILPANFYLI